VLVRRCEREALEAVQVQVRESTTETLEQFEHERATRESAESRLVTAEAQLSSARDRVAQLEAEVHVAGSCPVRAWAAARRASSLSSSSRGRTAASPAAFADVLGSRGQRGDTGSSRHARKCRSGFRNRVRVGGRRSADAV
jgi:hypothetical protein